METKLTKKELLKLWIMKNSGKIARNLLEKRFFVISEFTKEIEEDIMNFLFDQEDVDAVEKTELGIAVYPKKEWR